MCDTLFGSVERLFFKCLEFSSKRAAAPPTNKSADEAALSKEIEDLLSSSLVGDVTTAGWDVKIGIENLLRSALRGDTEIRFHSGSVDVNSRGLLAILFTRIKDRVVATAASSEPQRSASGTVVVGGASIPDIVFETPQVQRQYCPFCDADVTLVRCDTCEVEANAFQMAQTLDGSLFPKVADLFIRCLSLHTSGGAPESAATLRTEVDTLLSSSEIDELERGGWDVKLSIAKLLKDALTGVRSIKFDEVKGAIDPNSRAVFACLVHILRDRIAQDPSIAAAGFELERPYMPATVTPRLVTLRFHLNDNTRRFLEAHSDLFTRVSKLIVRGGSDREWVSDLLKDSLAYLITDSLFPSTESSHGSYISATSARKLDDCAAH